MKELDFDSE